MSTALVPETTDRPDTTPPTRAADTSRSLSPLSGPPLSKKVKRQNGFGAVASSSGVSANFANLAQTQKANATQEVRKRNNSSNMPLTEEEKLNLAIRTTKRGIYWHLEPDFEKKINALNLTSASLAQLMLCVAEYKNTVVFGTLLKAFQSKLTIDDQRQLMHTLAKEFPAYFPKAIFLLQKMALTTRIQTTAHLIEIYPYFRSKDFPFFKDDLNKLSAIVAKTLVSGTQEDIKKTNLFFKEIGAGVKGADISRELATQCHKAIQSVLENIQPQKNRLPQRPSIASRFSVQQHASEPRRAQQTELQENLLKNAFSENANRLGICFPWIAEMLDTANQQPDNRVKDLLGTWAQYANLHAWHLKIEPETQHSASSTLKAIFNYRKPELRYQLTDMWAAAFAADNQPASGRFTEIARHLSKPHSVMWRPVVFALGEKQLLSRPASTHISKIMSHDTFKKVESRDAVMNGLLALMQADDLPLAKRQQLLACLTPDVTGKQAAHAFATNLQDFAHFIPLIKHPDLGPIALTKLDTIEQAADVRRVIGEMFFHILNRQSGTGVSNTSPEILAGKLQDYQSRTGEPYSIMDYAIKMHCDLVDTALKEEVFATLNRFIDVTILSDDPAEFVRAKNDISSSTHLQKAEAVNPKALKHWLNIELVQKLFPKPAPSRLAVDIFEYFQKHVVHSDAMPENTYPTVDRYLKNEIDLGQARQTVMEPDESQLLQLFNPDLSEQDKIDVLDRFKPRFSKKDEKKREKFVHGLHQLQRLLAPVALIEKDFSEWNLKFHHDATAYLRCGSVAGSCQNLQDLAVWNKALMGYVMQGKNRLIALTSPDGRLQARCVVRLGIDPERQRLVMHLEKSYQNPGVPDDYSDQLLQFAKQVAGKVGVGLVTHADQFVATEYYEGQIHFYADSAACEYVDADDLGIVEGCQGYILMQAKQIDT